MYEQLKYGSLIVFNSDDEFTIPEPTVKLPPSCLFNNPIFQISAKGNENYESSNSPKNYKTGEYNWRIKFSTRDKW